MFIDSRNTVQLKNEQKEKAEKAIVIWEKIEKDIQKREEIVKDFQYSSTTFSETKLQIFSISDFSPKNISSKFIFDNKN